MPEMRPSRSDLSLRGIAAGAAIIVAGIAASLGGAWLVSSRVDAPLAGSGRGERPAVAGAVLQTAPAEDIAAFRREKEARLESRGPVDRDHMHIPIEQAMRILARGRER
jgi:hypothetical protein